MEVSPDSTELLFESLSSIARVFYFARRFLSSILVRRASSLTLTAPRRFESFKILMAHACSAAFQNPSPTQYTD